MDNEDHRKTKPIRNVVQELFRQESGRIVVGPIFVCGGLTLVSEAVRSFAYNSFSWDQLWRFTFGATVAFVGFDYCSNMYKIANILRSGNPIETNIRPQCYRPEVKFPSEEIVKFVLENYSLSYTSISSYTVTFGKELKTIRDDRRWFLSNKRKMVLLANKLQVISDRQKFETKRRMINFIGKKLAALSDQHRFKIGKREISILVKRLQAVSDHEKFDTEKRVISAIGRKLVALCDQQQIESSKRKISLLVRRLKVVSDQQSFDTNERIINAIGKELKALSDRQLFQKEERRISDEVVGRGRQRSQSERGAAKIPIRHRRTSSLSEEVKLFENAVFDHARKQGFADDQLFRVCHDKSKVNATQTTQTERNFDSLWEDAMARRIRFPSGEHEKEDGKEVERSFTAEPSRKEDLSCATEGATESRVRETEDSVEHNVDELGALEEILPI